MPLRDATVEGTDIRVPFGKEHIKAAPSMDAGGELFQPQEAELYATTVWSTRSTALTRDFPRGSDHEVTLTEEEPVVEKRTVPK